MVHRSMRRTEGLRLRHELIQEQRRDVHLCDLVASIPTTDAFCFMMSPFMDHVTTLVTEQMSAKKGLKVFGDAGAEAIEKELEQLVYRKVMYGKNP